MKVVINNCYGGFSLSPKAVKRMAELQGKECYFYEGGLSSQFVKVELEDLNEHSLSWTAFSVGDMEELNKLLKMQDNWHKMSDKEKYNFNKKYEEIELSMRPNDRADKFLVQVVEELGEEASGSCAKLKVVEIPEGVKYEISEYDGKEHIAEQHRTWS